MSALELVQLVGSAMAILWFAVLASAMLFIIFSKGKE